MNGWTAFWLFLAVFTVCECVIYLKGHDTALWSHKTEEEKASQRKAIDNDFGLPEPTKCPPMPDVKEPK